ncbi:putative transcriptional regulatory protein [Aspergillus affinis]|uniref:putative transcriptional regulatory protein n=1 Tax=Aspergillus affinis TaxID=1070780 RepID=UPI0022FE31EE|nr:putative transcriptional regulatory protein [Aspergillus affinis]KAI9037116.1 putative transcriptional regulatory protein [Aspergillus affinis]
MERRRRPAVSCVLCRKRKIRCNREQPCSNCLRSQSGSCIYENLNKPVAPKNHAGPSVINHPQGVLPDARASNASAALHSGPSSWTDRSTPTSQVYPQDEESQHLRLRIRELEEKLATATLMRSLSAGPAPSLDIETTNSRLSGTFHVHYRRAANGQPGTIAHSISMKSRLFGQSHWGVSVIFLIRDILAMLEPRLCPKTSKAWAGLEKCKALARCIKARRSRSLSSLSISPLPPRDLADQLVDAYLRTTESIYRILHVPTFRRQYDALWLRDGKPADVGFDAQLRLVLAIGAVTYDDTFSLRPSALRWIHEAQLLVSQLKFKARLTIQAIQNNLLLLFAQERLNAGEESAWVSMATLLRNAMYMGLHRDPGHLPQCTILVAEMRRRLWNTILEANLQASLSSGGSPMITLGDFDTAPPGNFDDEQLEVTDPVVTARFTKSSTAIALRRTFPQRLALCKFLNDLGSSRTYEETLRLDAELWGAYRELVHTLRSVNHYGGPSQYEIQVVDFLMHRYLLSLHTPYFGSGLHGMDFALSKKRVVESSLRLWLATCPTPMMSSVDEFRQLATCSAGFYPTVSLHAAFLIAVELRMQLQEDESLCPVPLRPDLLAVLEEAKAWCLRVLEAGETNVKGYLLISMITAQFQGLRSNLRRDEIAGLLIQAVENVEARCMPILERLAAALPEQGVEDWEFMVSIPSILDYLVVAHIHAQTTSQDAFNIGASEDLDCLFNDDLNLELY